MDPSHTNQEHDQETVLKTLSQGNRKAKNWLCNLSVEALRVLSPDIVDSIQKGIDSALTADMTPTPPTTSPERSVKTLASSAAVQTFSQEDLIAIKKLLANQGNIVAPAHFIQAEQTLGTLKMNAEEENRLSSLRRDTKSQASLEQTLRWINEFIIDHPLVSEESIVRNLHSVLPLATLPNLELLRMQGSGLNSIFLFLQLHFGTLKSPEELYRALTTLTATVTDDDPLRTLEKVSQLLLQVSGSNEECSKAARRESLKYLKLILTDESYLMLIQRLGEGNFSHLLSLTKGDYSEILLSRYKLIRQEAKRVRQVAVQPEQSGIVTVPESSSASGYTTHQASQDSEKQEILDFIRQVSSKTLICYRCNQEGHYARQCPQANSQPPKQSGQRSQKSYPNPNNPRPSQPSKAPYHSLRCSLHLNSKHTNGECMAQQNRACQIHHGHHSQSACNRMDFPKDRAQAPNTSSHQPWNSTPPSQPPWPQQNQFWNATPQPQNPSQPQWNPHTQNPNSWKPQPVPLFPIQPRVPPPLGIQQTSTLQPPPGLANPQAQQLRQITNQGAHSNPTPSLANAPDGFRADLWKLLTDWGLSPN